jgi:MFS family permease
MSVDAVRSAVGSRSRLTANQKVGFWAAWSGWTLDGMDSFIYALVLAPALTELLSKPGAPALPADVAATGSVLFALFLIGWGLAFLWGPIADRFGRTRTLALSIVVFAIFTCAAGFAQNVWELALFRFLAGIGIGGEWALAGTYVAEEWPEDRRKMGAGYLQTGYYVGFFLAAALNFTLGAHYGWRSMFFVGIVPVIVSLVVLTRVEEPKKWVATAKDAPRRRPLRTILSGVYLRRTIANTALLTVAIVGLWAGSVYVPTAITQIAKTAGYLKPEIVRLASLGTAILSIGTILGCICAPIIAERIGRKRAVAAYFVGMGIMIFVTFGVVFYLQAALTPFMIALFFLGFAGGNFALFSLWLPEQYETSVRATAFAFCTSFGRFIGAAINFGIAGLVRGMGTLGTPIALTAIAFGIGLLFLPLAKETVGETLPP